MDWQTDQASAYEAISQTQIELKAGAAFEMIVDKYTDCRDSGGDLGYITKGEMVEEFDDVVFNLGVGEVSNIFRTRFGLHIAKVLNRIPSAVLALHEVKDDIIKQLKEQMRNKAYEEFLDRLKQKAKIEEI